MNRRVNFYPSLVLVLMLGSDFRIVSVRFSLESIYIVGNESTDNSCRYLILNTIINLQQYKSLRVYMKFKIIKNNRLILLTGLESRVQFRSLDIHITLHFIDLPICV